jgi:ribokinase
VKVIVFGSINMDLVVTTPHLPRVGETLTGHSFFTAPGGKGANQAVAAARLGVETMMVGRVGDDSFAAPLMANLSNNGVDVTQVLRDMGVSSGVAFIAVDDAGENNIIIVPGANGRVDNSDVARLACIIAPGDILLLQLEVPLTTVISAARVAAEKQAMIILDPAPAQPLPDELITLSDIITPNETEAGLLTGITISDDAAAGSAIQSLNQRGSRQVLLKMGSGGAMWNTGDAMHHLPAYLVEAIDTVAAGDACNGGLAAGICAGLPLPEALQWAMAAGALATTKQGAQNAMPDRIALLDLISSRPEHGKTTSWV